MSTDPSSAGIGVTRLAGAATIAGLPMIVGIRMEVA